MGVPRLTHNSLHSANLSSGAAGCSQLLPLNVLRGLWKHRFVPLEHRLVLLWSRTRGTCPISGVTSIPLIWRGMMAEVLRRCWGFLVLIWQHESHTRGVAAASTRPSRHHSPCSSVSVRGAAVPECTR